ncbi:hypothetical protein F5050DRAFT_1206767 [Lentinula boryana]|uniref:Uncharacterized protein n=1 Tax=Lentinula boryana TaxID=40481 RepID=A0ABQ8QJ47_9AGAR|nr:hypothetical protein F5050DRAFT_1206767 [Lentinula boryana]
MFPSMLFFLPKHIYTFSRAVQTILGTKIAFFYVYVPIMIFKFQRLAIFLSRQPAYIRFSVFRFHHHYHEPTSCRSEHAITQYFCTTEYCTFGDLIGGRRNTIDTPHTQENVGLQLRTTSLHDPPGISRHTGILTALVAKADHVCCFIASRALLLNN